jgi:hypothetical protein
VRHVAEKAFSGTCIGVISGNQRNQECF